MPKQTVQDVLNYAEQTTQNEIVLPITLKADTAWTQKLTEANQRKVLQFLSKSFNLTTAANHVGVTRKALEHLIERDELFKAAYNEIKQFHLDNCESSMFMVASEPSRNGFNDRKLALQSLRPSTYGNKVEINKNQHVTIDMNIREMNQVLTGKPNVTPKVTSSSVDLESIELAEVE